MILPPAGFDDSQLLDLVDAHFGGAHGSLEFVPLGEDSWCYRLGELWISVRRDLRGHVPEAYRAAYELKQAGLDFILSPIVANDGRIVHYVAIDKPVVIYPYLPVKPLSAGGCTQADLATVATLIDKVHEAQVNVELPHETYALSFDDELDRALATADGALDDNGPYALRLRRLLSMHKDEIVSLRAECAELALKCSSSEQPLILTHGEPSAANIVRHGSQLLLADWGGAALGPPERDWFHVRRTLNEIGPRRPSFMEFFRVRWILSEIAEYVDILAGPHIGSAEDEAMWHRLLRYLPWNEHYK